MRLSSPTLGAILTRRIAFFAVLAMVLQLAVVFSDYYWNVGELSRLFVEQETERLASGIAVEDGTIRYRLPDSVEGRYGQAQTGYVARIRALTRRAPSTVMPVLEFAALQYDLATRQVICAGDEIALAPSEKGLLELLMRNGGQVVPKPKIEHAFSEFGDERSSNAVELAVSRLRKKLEGHPTQVLIETVRGVGYMMREVRA